MGNYQISFKLTGNIEGGYANDPNDRGGETYKGIARKIDSKWTGWSVIDSIKKKVGTSASAIDKEAATNELLQASVSTYYKVNYWDVLNLDGINDQRICSKLYDIGVNMGTGRSGLFVQRCLNVMNRNGTTFSDLKLDGQIGAKTVAIINSLPTSDLYMLWKLINALQGEKYIAICEANRSQETFIRSWASRIFETNQQ